MSALLNCSTIIFGDQTPIGMMNSASSFESSNSSPDSSQESATAQLGMQFQTHNIRELLFDSSILNRGEPFLKVNEEPVEKFRFRYKSEMMGTHGSILARSHERNRRKIYPSVQLCNYDRPAYVRCSLYTAHPNEKMRTPHTHRLIVRADNNMDKDDPHEMVVSADNNYIATFHGMGIIHTAKKNIVEELMKKKRARFLEKLQAKNVNIVSLTTLQEAQLRGEAEDEARKMNLNSVSLCFEAFIRDANNCFHPICEPVFSKPINNMKSALTGELKICRIDKHVSSCMGGEEVFILVEKVGKKNIKIKFFEVDDEDNEIWVDFGKFSELDVHHQYAIVFRTPPYRDLDIEKTVDVFVQLHRPTDGDCSEPIKFQYKPSEKMGRTRKRQRICNESISSLGDQNIRLFNPMNGITNGNNDLVPDLKSSSDLYFDHEQVSLNDLLCDENGLDSIGFQEFMRNLSIQDLHLPQTQSGCGGLVGSEILKPVKYDMDPVCTGAFILNPSDIPFAGGLKTEGIIASDYMKTFEGEEIVCDGEVTRNKANSLLISTGNSKSLEEDGKIKRETEEHAVKKESAGDFNLLQKAIVHINTVLQEKLSFDIFAKKVEEIFSITNEEGDNALHAAVMRGHKDALKLMLEVLGRRRHLNVINSQNSSSETPLHLAVLHNHTEFIKMLLTKGADPNCVNKDGNTPIHLAISCAHNDCLVELLNKNNYIHNSLKPKTDVKNDSGQTALHLSALRKNLFAVKTLVANGANVNAVDSTLGRHVLLVSVQEGNKEIVEYLLKETNVDVNLANYAGYTALHYACVLGDVGNPELCKLLIDAKADPLKANHEQRTRAAELALGALMKQTDVTVKEEIESEDELQLRIDDDEDDEEEDDDDEEGYEESSQGQTSVDLAKNNKEILEILQRAEQCNSPGIQETVRAHVQVKEERVSPDGLSTTADNGLFDEETLGKLCALLDASKGWTNLADLLDYSFLVPSIRNATSPTKLLFNYADLHGNVTVQNIRNFLEALDETQSVEAIDLMLARQVANSEGSQ